MDIPIHRFWDKYRNMMILKIELKLQSINILRLAYSDKDDGEISKMNMIIEQLGKPQRVDSLTDIKQKQKQMDRKIKEKHEKDW